MNSSNKIKNFAKISLMTALLCVCSPFVLAIPLSPVPISLSTFVLYLIIIILDYKQSIICTLLYLLIGFVGMPVFSGFQGGIGVLFGPTGGYLFGYIVLVIISVAILNKFTKSLSMCILSLSLGTICLYIIGTIWLCKITNMNFKTAFVAGVLPFIVLDVLKILSASVIGLKIQHALQSYIR